MPVRTLADDRRALSEGFGLAILVGFTVVVTASVGLNVLVVSGMDTGPPRANFTYDYIDQSDALLVTHDEGDEFEAGSLVVTGPSAEATWAAVASVGNSSTVGPGSAIQLSGRSAYGQPVGSADEIAIHHERGDNRTQLSEWTGTTSGLSLGPAPTLGGATVKPSARTAGDIAGP